MGHREKVFINGVEAPSVTQVLGVVRKEFLERWRGKLGNQECDRIVRDSQELGHRFHNAIESYFRGEEIEELPRREAEMFALFRGWALESKFNPIELEMPLESQNYSYQGCCDAIGRLDNDQIIIADWKTSGGIDSLYPVQLAAYAAAYQEQTGVQINSGLIVRVDKKSTAKKPIEIKRYDNLSDYMPCFLACLTVYRYLHK